MKALFNTKHIPAVYRPYSHVLHWIDNSRLHSNSGHQACCGDYVNGELIKVLTHEEAMKFALDKRKLYPKQSQTLIEMKTGRILESYTPKCEGCKLCKKNTSI